MFDNKSQLKKEVREMTGYTSDLALSPNGLDTAYGNAKRHIRIKKSLDADFNWFGTEKVAAQDALYWWTCLFSKVQTGELDSQDLQAGAVDQKTLLANEDGEVTMWYRQASGALESIKSSSIIQASSPTRSGRAYSAGNFEEQNGGGGGSGSSGGSDVETDL